MGKLEAPRMEATPEPPGSLASSPPGSSSLSSPSPGSQSPISTPPLFRVLALPGPEPVQPAGQEPLIERLPGYRRIVIPREPTLLEILKRSAGVSRDEDVLRLRAATLRVVAARVSLRRLESLTPRLRTLRLDGSALSSLREIGTGLRHLKVLHVARCGLTSLDGVLGVARLEELHAPGNRITGVAPLAPLSHLHTLDLSDNPVEAGGLWLASLCGRLRHMRLRGSVAAARADYRAFVARSLPRLLTLDAQSLRRGDDELDAVELTEQIVFSGHFSSDSEEEDILASSDAPDETDSADSLADLDKEGDSADDANVCRTRRVQPAAPRPCTAPARGAAPASSARPRSARPARPYEAPVSLAELRTVPSLLTSGRPLCGNLARALRLPPESRPAARRLAAASSVLSRSPPARPEARAPSAPLELGLAGAGDGGRAPPAPPAPPAPDACAAARRWRQRWTAFRESARLLDETYSEAGPSGLYSLPDENHERIGEQEE